MLATEQARRRAGARAVIVFEGQDAAGKGGAIRRLTSRLDPRGCKVWPIGAPSPDEQGRHYLWRFWARLPEPGGIAVFDRSWYGRVLVERVEKLAAKAAWRRAYDEINEFERLLGDDGVTIVKLFLHVSPEEQLRRFRERLEDPGQALETHRRGFPQSRPLRRLSRRLPRHVRPNLTRAAPWRAVASDDKWTARVDAIEYAAERLAEDVALDSLPPDPAIVRAVEAAEAEARRADRQNSRAAPAMTAAATAAPARKAPTRPPARGARAARAAGAAPARRSRAVSA